MLRLTRVAAILAVVGALGAGASARADVYVAFLSGAAEAPPNASPGTGFATITFDPTIHLLRVQVTFSGLLGTVTNSHIHAATAQPLTGTAGVATQLPTFSGFPSGVTSGSYDGTFDTSLASSWNAAYITANGGTTAGAEAAFKLALDTGRAYLNIHTTVVPAGEIRGFAVVPEPSPLVLGTVAGGLALVIGRLRRAR